MARFLPSFSPRLRSALLGVTGATMLAGCVYIPPGPHVMVMPGRDKSPEAFEYDDLDCRGFAASRVDPDYRAANQTVVANATVGTVVGAAAGAAIGAAAGDPATGAAVGAGFGLLGGTAAGASQADYARWTVQQRYDAAYADCMYAKGNRIPVPRDSQAARDLVPPPAPLPRSRHDVPPPPPGRPPSPPPGVAY